MKTKEKKKQNENLNTMLGDYEIIVGLELHVNFIKSRLKIGGEVVLHKIKNSNCVKLWTLQNTTHLTR